jgi:tetraacyldisaccharide-1-P 4'-kinase
MITGTLAFRDHHAFDQADVGRIVDAARASGATVVVTTGKDAIRLEGLDLSTMPFAVVPLHTSIEPHDAFSAWLADRLSRARAQGDRSAT